MTVNEVRSSLAAYAKAEGDLDALRAWLLPLSREAADHEEEFEVLVGSVGYLFARLSTGVMAEPEFWEQLRILADTPEKERALY
jgi:hypothetical protein